MSWLDRVKQYAPDIALALATGGASAVKTAALRVLAKEITGNPDASEVEISAAVDSATPEQLFRLTVANHDYQLERARIGLHQMQTVNQTIQVEARAESWWVSAWRPFWGFVSAIAFAIVAITIAVALAILALDSPEKFIPQLPLIIGALASLFAIPGAILGVSAWHRGQEKRIRAGEIQGGGK